MSRIHRIAQQAIADSLIDGLLHWMRRPGDFHHRSFTFDLFSFNHYGAENVMARSKRKPNNATGGNTAQSNGGLVWANIALDPEETALVEQLCAEPDRVGIELAQLFQKQGNFSLKYNPDRSNYSAFIVASGGDGDGVQRGISASANTGIAAAAAVLFKLRLFIADPSRGVAPSGGMGIR